MKDTSDQNFGVNDDLEELMSISKASKSVVGGENSTGLLSKLSETSLLKLHQRIEEQIFLPDTLILEQGSKNNFIYIILEGEVEVKVFDNYYREKHRSLTTLTEGNYFGTNAINKKYSVESEYYAKTKVICQVFNLRKNAKILKPVLKRIKAEYIRSRNLAIDTLASATSSVNFKFSDLSHVKALGVGAFGRVSLVKHEETGKLYALKTFQKAYLVKMKQHKNVLNEKYVMLKANHSFILVLHTTFTSKNCLYFLLDFVQGGELYQLLQTSDGRLKPSRAKFYAACVVEALTYLHRRQIVYRDLKPENLMIDSDGYLRVIDFGFSKRVLNRTYTLCGTIEYLAPEVIEEIGHDISADYWAIGVLIYELICGFTPFMAETQELVFEKVMKNNFAFPTNFPKEANNLVRSLMKTDPSERLGMQENGGQDIKTHAWFKSIDFKCLVEKQIKTPWKPKISHSTDTRHFSVDNDNYKETTYRGSNKYWRNF